MDAVMELVKAPWSDVVAACQSHYTASVPSGEQMEKLLEEHKTAVLTGKATPADKPIIPVNVSCLLHLVYTVLQTNKGTMLSTTSCALR